MNSRKRTARKMKETLRQPRLSVVIPCFNEGDRIFITLKETSRVLASLCEDYEIVVVDDGSTDETALEVEKAACEFANIRLVRIPENRGKGNALRRGFHVSKNELVCFLDADLDLHPSQIETLAEKMNAAGADIVIGSKRHPESKLDYPWYRKLFSTTYYLLILILFRLPLKDTQTGIKLFKREVLSSVFPRVVCKLYTLDLEIMAVAHRLGYSIAEAPIVLTFQGKLGRIKWVDIRNIIVDTLAVFYRMYFLKYYDSPLRSPVDWEPFISIIIPVAPEGCLDSRFSKCLSKCAELHYPNYEIVLVGDIDAIHEGEEVHALTQIRCKAENMASVLNAGVRRSNGEIIAFLGENCYPDSEWLRNAIPYFLETDVAAVCGPTLNPPEASKIEQAAGLTFSSTLVSGFTTFRYAYHAMRGVDDCPRWDLIVRREDFESVGGFDESLSYGEDTVLSMRLTKERERKIMYVPNAAVFHYKPPILLPHLKTVFSYGRHRGCFFRRYPETSRRFQYAIPSLFVLFLVLGTIAAFFSRHELIVFSSVMGLYFLMCLFSSIKTLDPLMNLLVFLGIVTSNISYGVGFFLGVVGLREKS